MKRSKTKSRIFGRSWNVSAVWSGALFAVSGAGSLFGGCNVVRIDDENRVGPDRRVVFFVHSHYHLDGLSPEAIQARQNMIAARLAEVGQHFLDQGVNLTFAEALSSGEADDGVLVRVVNPSCSPGGLSAEELAMVALGDSDPDRIHIHWIDRFADENGVTVLIAGIGLLPGCQARPPEENNALILTTHESPMTTTLAHEMGHYFGLPHLNVSGNLMHANELGRGSDPVLTSEQRDQIWDTIHNERAHLGFLSFLLDK